MNRQVSEKNIEDYLRLRVKQMGGRAYKFVSPGNAGVPDRLVALPGGRIAFIELKAPGKKPTPLQMKKMRELHGLGFISGWADSKDAVDGFLDRMLIVSDDNTAVLMDILEAGGGQF
ncbi:VRR-NUC domain-containing protein [Clostridiales Family XIII bacterium ASD5510]|uniref:VRR-NUC domain-containing protein n=1 Tax=Hominibacterium faecale TaxID=2839743 RepID=A0A9J6QZF8_9FIRM|nr:VRR-NUC domain-containing protein [Hominibacterium faecale]MCU7380834.1 VRR-NUC domain-containing protein [Hominibacterium faecale]